MFGSLTAIQGLREQGIPHARCVLLIETCEESVSYDLPAYVDALAERIGEPSLVVCLDSGAGNHEQHATGPADGLEPAFILKNTKRELS